MLKGKNNLIHAVMFNFANVCFLIAQDFGDCSCNDRNGLISGLKRIQFSHNVGEHHLCFY